MEPRLDSHKRVMIGISVFAVSFALTLWIALPQWLNTTFYGLPVTASIDQLLPVLGGSDAGSYLAAATDLQDGNLSGANQWVLNLWPPGMPFILASMIKLGGGASPVLPMVFLICTLWSSVLATLATILIPRRGFLSFTVFAFLWLVSPVFTGWTIHNGILGSDGLATAIGALVAIGLIWTTWSAPQRWPAYLAYVAIGIGLASLAYLRIMWFYAVPAALGIVAAAGLIRLVVLWARGKRDLIAKQKRSYFAWGILGATFLVLCAPWTAYVGTVLHPGSFSWSQGDYQWAQLWMSDEYLEANGAGFLETGGGNWPCDLAPNECERLSQQEFAAESPYSGQTNSFTDFRQEAISVALTHPFEFIGDRTSVTVQAWLSTPGASVGSFGNVGFGIVTAIAFLASIVILISQSLKRRAAPLLLLLLLGANLGILWLTHFETRYIVPVQAISLIVVAFFALKFEARLWERTVARSARLSTRPPVEGVSRSA